MKGITGLLVGFLMVFCIGFFSYVTILSVNPVSDLIGDGVNSAIIATLGLLIITVIAGVVGFFVVVRLIEKIENGGG